MAKKGIDFGLVGRFVERAGKAGGKAIGAGVKGGGKAIGAGHKGATKAMKGLKRR